MGKKPKPGSRGERREQARLGRVQDALARLQSTAEAQGISLEEAGEQLAELSRIRDEYSVQLKDSGMVIQDVRYDPETGNVEVIVKPITIEGEPAGWSDLAMSRLGDVRQQLEKDLLAKGRGRVAQVELTQARGPAQSALGLLMGAGAYPELVARAAPRGPVIKLLEGSGLLAKNIDVYAAGQEAHVGASGLEK